MSYNSNKYNTRNSGRFNTPGQFVSGGELLPGANPPRPSPAPRAPPLPPTTPLFPSKSNVHQQPPQHQQQQHQHQPQQQQQQLFPQAQAPRTQNLQMIQTMDVEMKTEPGLDTSSVGSGDANGGRPHWMKTKMAGVKKVTNKERRRRQNEALRKLLTPKNALMVLNEMMPHEHLANQFKVEPSSQYNVNQYYSKAPGHHSFCADLTIDGNTYKGYGENKLTARNAAAEQAIRDLMIKKMSRVLADSAAAAAATPATAATAGAANSANAGNTGNAAGDAGSAGNSAEGAGAEEAAADEEAMPMIQLASFALHKLFSEWEYEGHKVPQLKPNPNAVATPEGAGEAAAAAAPGPKKAAKKPKELPANAATMHPCMLLTYMRPHLEYRELAVEGDRPQNMIFTLGVDVDGATYIGKAANKKEARKQAARAACQALFAVNFDDAAPQ